MTSSKVQGHRFWMTLWPCPFSRGPSLYTKSSRYIYISSTYWWKLGFPIFHSYRVIHKNAYFDIWTLARSRLKDNVQVSGIIRLLPGPISPIGFHRFGSVISELQLQEIWNFEVDLWPWHLIKVTNSLGFYYRLNLCDLIDWVLYPHHCIWKILTFFHVDVIFEWPCDLDLLFKVNFFGIDNSR